ncbi:MAG: PGL/p-HBAD biosynthesis glycosyltransferase [Syntrophomonadaceae bacterium]|nr:PGL/p-HBAD biosynthesis glycosyltransferase [Bacillota bacterium]
MLKANEDVIDYWVSEPDNGIYDAWNKGVRLSGGDWIAFLGADDIYMKGAIQAYVTSINACRDKLPQYVSSRVNLTSGSKVLRTIGQQWIWKVFSKYMNVAHVGSLHHRILFERYGLFDETYKICGDYEFLLRPGSDLRADYLNAITANMSIGGISSTNYLAFRETARAKVATGGRNVLLSQIEKYWVVVKWKLRNYLCR